MNTIWKYNLARAMEHRVPKGAKALYFDMQNHDPCHVFSRVKP